MRKIIYNDVTFRKAAAFMEKFYDPQSKYYLEATIWYEGTNLRGNVEIEIPVSCAYQTEIIKVAAEMLS